MTRPKSIQWLWIEIYRVLQWQQENSGQSNIQQVSFGLNIEFDEVRGRIIGKQPLSPIG